MYVIQILGYPLKDGEMPSILTDVEPSGIFPEGSLGFFRPTGLEAKLPVIKFNELCRQGFCGRARCSIRSPSGKLIRRIVPYVMESHSLAYLRSQVGQNVGNLGLLVHVNFIEGKSTLRS